MSRAPRHSAGGFLSYSALPGSHRTGTLVFFRDAPTRAVVGVCLSLCFAFTYEKLAPYVSRPLNALSTAAVSQVVLIYGAGLMLVARPCGFSELGLGVFLFIAILSNFGMAVFLQFEVRREQNSRLTTLNRAPFPSAPAQRRKRIATRKCWTRSARALED